MTESTIESSFDEFAEDDGVLQSNDSLDGNLRDDVLDTGVDAGEGYRASTRYGTTPDEARAGESLDQLLSAEEPDLRLDFIWSDEDDPPDEGHLAQERAGRLLAPDEGAHRVEETDLIAFDVGIDGAGASPEEAAVHLCDDPPWT